MRIFVRVSTLFLTGAVLLVTACGTPKAGNVSKAEKAMMSTHTRAVKAFRDEDYPRSSALWREALDQAYALNRPDAAARYHYNLGLSLWNELKGGRVTGPGDARRRVLQQFEAAKLLQMRTGDPAAWLLLAEAEFDLASGGARQAEENTQIVLRRSGAAPAEILQALLIRMEAASSPSSRQVFEDASGWTQEDCLKAAQRGIGKVESPELRRRYFYQAALFAGKSGDLDGVLENLARTLDEARLSGAGEDVAMHLFEWSRIESMRGNAHEAADLAYLSARAWRAVGQDSKASYVLWMAESDIRDCHFDPLKDAIRVFLEDLPPAPAGAPPVQVQSELIRVLVEASDGL